MESHEDVHYNFIKMVHDALLDRLKTETWRYVNIDGDILCNCHKICMPIQARNAMLQLLQ